MIVCKNCAASNADGTKYCGECGFALASPTEDPAPPRADGTGGTDGRTLRDKAKALQSGRKADILFVLDTTGSMGGEIKGMVDTICAFGDTVKSEGVRARLGLIEFRDRLINEEHRVLTFAGEVFTSDPEAFRREVSTLKAAGGGDAPESSLDALRLALTQPFAKDSQKAIVLITDAPPHVPDRETKSVDEIVDAMKARGVDHVHLVIRTQDPNSHVYLRLLEGRKGMAYDLGRGDEFTTRAEHFKRTLMGLGKTLSMATR